jgi:hypothetical protein
MHEYGKGAPGTPQIHSQSCQIYLADAQTNDLGGHENVFKTESALGFTILASHATAIRRTFKVFGKHSVH